MEGQANHLINGDLDIQEAVGLIACMKFANDSLSEISKAMLAEEDEESLEDECVKIIEYEEKAMAAVSKLEYAISRKNMAGDEARESQPATGNIANGGNTNDTGNGGDANRVDNGEQTGPRRQKMSVRLPKLELIKFNGNYNNWPAF